MFRMSSTSRGRLKHRAQVSLMVLFALLAPTAHAFIDPPWITPQTPRAGEMVSVNLRMGVCDAIFFRPGYPQITQQGNAIRVLEYGDHVTFNDFCIYDVGTTIDPIGVLPPGDYTLTVDFLYLDFAFGATIMNLGVIPFTVTGAAPVVPVPAFNRWGLAALSAIVLGSAVLVLWIRRRGLRCEHGPHEV